MPTDDITSLLLAAVKARHQAYAPYSKYQVGAALLTSSGETFTGCNVENASYGLTICAERSALFKAVSEGHKKFIAIAVVTADAGMPCGACRQVLHEFAPDLRIVIGNPAGALIKESNLNLLLPDAFGPDSL